jgi:hypothetical protein
MTDPRLFGLAARFDHMGLYYTTDLGGLKCFAADQADNRTKTNSKGSADEL